MSLSHNPIRDPELSLDLPASSHLNTNTRMQKEAGHSLTHITPRSSQVTCLVLYPLPPSGIGFSFAASARFQQMPCWIGGYRLDSTKPFLVGVRMLDQYPAPVKVGWSAFAVACLFSGVRLVMELNTHWLVWEHASYVYWKGEPGLECCSPVSLACGHHKLMISSVVEPLLVPSYPFFVILIEKRYGALSKKWLSYYCILMERYKNTSDH